MKLLTYIEVDVPDFAGGSPEEIVTYRFTVATDYLPADIEAIPSLTDVSYSPSTLSLGENLGERATLTATFKDHKHIFNGESYDSGTFWGKWRARYGLRIRGRAMRWIQGYVGQAIADMETRHFIIDASSGPSLDGSYQIVGKDILKLTDDERSQAPVLSSGFIVSNIDTDDVTITLSPSGIGDLEYPASGYVAIGGTEICSFTRSGNTMTIVRGQQGTVAASHESGERVQLVLIYSGEDPADIIADLLETYASIDASYIPIDAWRNETSNFVQTLYSAVISEPTSVKKLVSELAEQAALAIWWEPLIPEIRLKVIRKIATDAESYDESNIMEGTLSIGEQPDARISQVWTYFGQRNSLRPIDETDNYRSVALTADLETETEYGGTSIKKIMSRWIPFGARSVALRLNDLILSRFNNPPRACTFSLWKHGYGSPMMGGGYQLSAWTVQNVDGSTAYMPIQITRLNPTEERYEVEAQEMLAAEVLPTDLVNRVVIIDGSINNINLKDIHDNIYPEVTGDESPAVSVTFIISENVIVGSDTTAVPACIVGVWPAGFVPTIKLYGRIQGAGGNGGIGAVPPTNGLPGGTALYTRNNVDVLSYAGQIWGGGGGGGGGYIAGGDDNPDEAGSGGGGGAGENPGNGGAGAIEGGDAGTTEAGGLGGDGKNGIVEKGYGGDGGDPGQSGNSGDGSSGGAAGSAIDGVSYITFSSPDPDIRGAQVN